MNLTQPVRKANLKRWKAQGPAITQSPLKALHSAYPDFKAVKGEYDGEHPIYASARRASARGDGLHVKRLAAQIAH